MDRKHLWEKWADEEYSEGIISKSNHKGVTMPEKNCIDWITRGVVALSVITLSGCEGLVVHEMPRVLFGSFQRS